MKNRGAVARYLRIGEEIAGPSHATELRPHELGESGGAIARYLKIERHERPATKEASTPRKQSRAPKSRRPMKQPKTTVVVELDAADIPTPVAIHHEAPKLVQVRYEAPEVHKHEPREEPVPAPVVAATVQCPDCEVEIPWGTDQCPSCALFLPKAA